VKIDPNSQRPHPGPASPQIRARSPSHPNWTIPDDGARSVMPDEGSRLALSAPAEQLRRMRLQLEDLPMPPNGNRVAELGSLIRRGVYSVDVEAVAEAILDDEAIGRALASQLAGLPIWPEA
jgi:anti-sigma28 factor (negative regulator of flagellin synthesis)